MFVAVEQARSMSMFATMATDFDDPKERAKAVAAAKVQIGKSGKFVGQQSIQLHGGIGMTQEAKIGHYFKRLTMIENTFGDTDYHTPPRQRGAAGWCNHPVIASHTLSCPANARHPMPGTAKQSVTAAGDTGLLALAPRNDGKKQAEETTMKNTPFDLTGQVAVVTGSSRGIGRSSAELLAKLGAKVVISSRKADACQEVADGIKQGRRRCPCHPLQHLAP